MDAETPKSRTQKKNEDRALQRLGERLLTLSAEQLAAIDLPEELNQAIHAGRRMKSHGARRRQLQYIGVLMRNVDAAAIRTALERIRGGEVAQARAFKKLEAWRDALREGDETILEEILDQCRNADRQRLIQLMRNARPEVGSDKATKASRMLFRYLREIYDD
jgi:ribosome-associated protein